jgi:hypothetical protein
MKLLANNCFAIAWTCLLVMGCGRSPSSANLNLGGPSGVVTWTAVGKDNPLPGIDEGTIYHLGTTFVFWSDAPGGGGGSSSSNAQGIRCQGSVVGRDGQRVEFHCETKDAKTGQVTINGITHDLANGNLFLVSTAAGGPPVKQLKRNLGGLMLDRADRDALAAFARNDPDIAGFFAKAPKRQ